MCAFVPRHAQRLTCTEQAAHVSPLFAEEYSRRAHLGYRAEPIIKPNLVFLVVVHPAQLNSTSSTLARTSRSELEGRFEEGDMESVVDEGADSQASKEKLEALLSHCLQPASIYFTTYHIPKERASEAIRSLREEIPSVVGWAMANIGLGLRTGSSEEVGHMIALRFKSISPHDFDNWRDSVGMFLERVVGLCTGQEADVKSQSRPRKSVHVNYIGSSPHLKCE